MDHILYLQNHSTRGAFTQDRIHILELLCTQAAISLENARLYDQEQEKTQTLQTSVDQLQQSETRFRYRIPHVIGFLNGSIQNAQTYLQDLSEHLELYPQHHPHAAAPVQENAEDIDLDYLLEDFPKLLDSMTAASQRIKSISNSLRQRKPSRY